MVKEKKYPRVFYNWLEDVRTIEKLLKLCTDKLSATKFLAIILKVGSRGKSAVDRARELICEFRTFRSIESKSFAELKRKW